MTQTNDLPPGAVIAEGRPVPAGARDLFARHRIDNDAAENGVWVKIRGDEFLVARLGSQRTMEDRAQFLAEKGLAPTANIPMEFQGEWLTRAFSRTVLLDVRWKDSPDLKYDETQGARIYNDPTLTDLKEQLMARATGDWTKHSLAAEAALGNLALRSNGSTSAAT